MLRRSCTPAQCAAACFMEELLVLSDYSVVSVYRFNGGGILQMRWRRILFYRESHHIWSSVCRNEATALNDTALTVAFLDRESLVFDDPPLEKIPACHEPLRATTVAPRVAYSISMHYVQGSKFTLELFACSFQGLPCCQIRGREQVKVLIR